MLLEFTKMHGCGNDYIYIDCFEGMPEHVEDLARTLSRRHFFFFSDGLICVCKSDVADAAMRMFNADGSEGSMCGNGVRCVAQWLYERKLAGEQMTIETRAGIKTLQRVGEGIWQVEMGKASFLPQEIPVLGLGDQPVLDMTVAVADMPWNITCVSMGNPHCVTFVKDTATLDLEKIGPSFEKHPAFPKQVNTEFIQIADENHLIMRVWERGSGETLACGTGACASAAAAVALGICKHDTDIKVDLLGGTLVICVEKDWNVRMTGPAQTVFNGVVHL